MKTLVRSLALACSLALPLAAAAQAFPSKPLRIIVPFAPGGATDVLARLFGGEMQKSFGQTVVVENKPGAGGNIGAEAGAKAAPDGYTLTLVAHGFMSVNPHVYKSLGYDSIRDFAPVTQLVTAPLLFVTNPNALPAKNLREILDFAKASPGKLVIGNGGSGTAQHLAGELFSSMAGVNVAFCRVTEAVAGFCVPVVSPPHAARARRPARATDERMHAPERGRSRAIRD